MIRLWNRVGIFRTLSVVTLILGLIGGLLLAGREAEHDFTSTTVVAAHGADDIRQLEQDLADRKSAQDKADDLATADADRAKAADDQARKNKVASRSEDRTETTTGVTAGPVPASCASYSGHKATGCTLMLKSGFALSQMPCLDKLWTKESHWNPKASNSSTGAYGIPQALPGSKMAVFGSDWKTNPATQIAWGLNYIKGRYKTPCKAWSHMQSTGWY